MTGQRPCKCPTCGADYVSDRPRVDLGRNVFICSAGVARLRPQVAEIASMLVEHYPDTVRAERLLHGLYGWQDGPEYPDVALRVCVSQLRSAIASLGWGVKSVHAVGWTLIASEPEGGAS